MPHILLLPLRRKACWEFSGRPKNPTASAGFEPANSGSSGQYASHVTTEAVFLSVNHFLLYFQTSVLCKCRQSMTTFDFSQAITDIWCRGKGAAWQSDINLCTPLNLFTSDELFMTRGALGRLRYPFIWPCNIRVRYCASVLLDPTLRKIVPALIYCRNSTGHKISKNKFCSVWVLQTGLALFKLIESNPTPVLSNNFLQEAKSAICTS